MLQKDQISYNSQQSCGWRQMHFSSKYCDSSLLSVTALTVCLFTSLSSADIHLSPLLVWKMEITNFHCVFPVSQNIVTRLCLIGIHSTFVLFFKDFHYVSLVHQWDHSFIICRFFCSNVRIRWYWWGVKFAFCLMLNYLFFPSLSPRINGKLSMMNIKNKKKISSNEIRSKWPDSPPEKPPRIHKTNTPRTNPTM